MRSPVLVSTQPKKRNLLGSQPAEVGQKHGKLSGTYVADKMPTIVLFTHCFSLPPSLLCLYSLIPTRHRPINNTLALPFLTKTVSLKEHMLGKYVQQSTLM